jgi:adenylate cyclase
VLFVDVIGSTTLAATELPPAEVVELLNAFFAIVVAGRPRRTAAG